MALVINQNLYSSNSQFYLGLSQAALGKSIERLSSGLRINHASDDASGMAISEKMRGQISGLKRATMNAQDGISYLQTAEGAMEQASAMLQRMRELAVQAANGTYTTNDRAEIQKEVDQLKAEINRISTSTEFNTRKLINGDGTGLWSADTDLIGAVLRAPVREGNYAINMSVRPGKNQIYKSEILTLNKNAIGAQIDSDVPNTTNVDNISKPENMPPSGDTNYVTQVTDGTMKHEVPPLNPQTTSSLPLNIKADPASSYTPVNGQAYNIGTTTATAVTADTSLTKAYYVSLVALNSAGSPAPADYSVTIIDPTTGQPVSGTATLTGTGPTLTVELNGQPIGTFTSGASTATNSLVLSFSPPATGAATDHSVTINGGPNAIYPQQLVSGQPALTQNVDYYIPDTSGTSVVFTKVTVTLSNPAVTIDTGSNVKSVDTKYGSDIVINTNQTNLGNIPKSATVIKSTGSTFGTTSIPTPDYNSLSGYAVIKYNNDRAAGDTPQQSDFTITLIDSKTGNEVTLTQNQFTYNPVNKTITVKHGMSTTANNGIPTAHFTFQVQSPTVTKGDATIIKLEGDQTDGITVTTPAVGTPYTTFTSTPGFSGTFEINASPVGTAIASASFTVIIDGVTLPSSAYTFNNTDTVTINYQGRVMTFVYDVATTPNVTAGTNDIIVLQVRQGNSGANNDNIVKLNDGPQVRYPGGLTGTETDATYYLVTYDPISNTVIKDAVNLAINNPAVTNRTTTFTANGVDQRASASVINKYYNNGSSWTTEKVHTNSIAESGYVVVEMLNSTSDLTQAKYRARFISAKTGMQSSWVNFPNTTVGSDNKSIVVKMDGVDLSIDTVLGTGGLIQSGDKLLLAVSQSIGNVALGGGTIQINQGPDNVANGPRVVYSDQSSITPTSTGGATPQKNPIQIYNVNMDGKTGNINIGSIVMEFKEMPKLKPTDIAATTPTGTFEFSIIGSDGPATTSTKLKDIKAFTDADNNNIFDTKQDLTIYGNGSSTVVHLEGNDTIATLISKLTKAIVTDLKMGSSDPDVNANLIRYITDPVAGGIDAVRGTLIIQTALTGTQGELSFVGAQPLINALALAQVQASNNNESTVTIRDAHTGDLIGTEVTGNDRVYSVIDGTEVIIDSRAGVKSTWDPDTRSIIFSSDTSLSDKTYHLHLVDNRTSLQIGSNKGQDLDVSIPQLDLKGLGLENTTIVTQELARSAIGDIDEAITKVVSARATVGAQVSRLEHTVENLATARQNLSTAESRIRDLDVAEESANFTRNQILVQSGISMLAQANQLPQMALQLLQK